MGFVDQLLVAPGKTQLTEKFQPRPAKGRQNALADSKVGQEFHFLQALQRRGAGTGGLKLMA
jgi:hypothetical protein